MLALMKTAALITIEVDAQSPHDKQIDRRDGSVYRPIGNSAIKCRGSHKRCQNVAQTTTCGNKYVKITANTANLKSRAQRRVTGRHTWPTAELLIRARSCSRMSGACRTFSDASSYARLRTCVIHCERKCRCVSIKELMQHRRRF